MASPHVRRSKISAWRSLYRMQFLPPLVSFVACMTLTGLSGCGRVSNGLVTGVEVRPRVVLSGVSFLTHIQVATSHARPCLRRQMSRPSARLSSRARILLLWREPGSLLPPVRQPRSDIWCGATRGNPTLLTGIPTFRGAGGYWKRYNAMSLATPEAFEENPSLVWQFYHYRRMKFASVAIAC